MTEAVAEKAVALRRAFKYGIEHGKRRVAVGVDEIEALFDILREIKSERDDLLAACEDIEALFVKLELTPPTDENLARQQAIGERLAHVGVRLAALTRDELLELLGEIAPVVLQGWGPTHESRVGTEVLA